ncbi:hypothetical protein BKK79_32390 [Cupriavidus sp. USMAA2-4]|nr:hypothetical protein BKK79_32390 [Cupriavidus sp. USMAA2-4]
MRPLSTLESGLALAKQMPGLQYDAAGDAFALCDSECGYGLLRIEVVLTVLCALDAACAMAQASSDA